MSYCHKTLFHGVTSSGLETRLTPHQRRHFRLETISPLMSGSTSSGEAAALSTGTHAQLKAQATMATLRCFFALLL